MYNKLFTKILDSSIWLENQPTRIVWVTFIACMDQEGTVALSSIGNVANRARVSLEEAEAAIHCLESPDEHNPDQEHEGRRIERIPGLGWTVLNSKKYRDIVTAETVRAQTRERVRKYRSNAPVTHGNENVTPSEAEAEAEEKNPTEAVAETIWDEFTALQVRQGILPGTARARLGKLIKTYGQTAVIQTYAEIKNILGDKANAYAYFQGAIKNYKPEQGVKRNADGSYTVGSPEDFQRLIEMNLEY